MYGSVVLLSLKLSSGHCANAGLVVVALMCTCKFVTCSVCEYVHFVRCMGRQQLIMTTCIHIVDEQPTYIHVGIHMLLDITCYCIWIVDLGKI